MMSVASRASARASPSSAPSSSRARSTTPRSGYRSRHRAVARATSEKAKPDWAGDDALSKLVDAAISNELLYENIMKPMARRTLIQTAEKNGIQWRDEAKRLEGDSRVYEAFEAIKDDSMEYPEYYLKPFHAYSEGNLCWLAATEARSATYSMALRVWPKDRITAETAQQQQRKS